MPIKARWLPDLRAGRPQGVGFCQNAVVAVGTDTGRLRDLVSEAAGCLADLCTHDILGGACAGLGLPEPPRQAEPHSGEGLTKSQRVRWSLARLADEEVPAVARRMLDGRLSAALDAATRNAIEDILWTGHRPRLAVAASRWRRSSARCRPISCGGL